MKIGRNYRQDLVRRLRVLKSGTVLDAGTGAGTMTKTLANGLNLFVLSIDANKRVFQQISEKIDRENAGFIACDFAHLPLRKSVLAGIVCDLVISTSHEWKPSAICTEFRRVLRSKSSLFITDYYPEKTSTTKEASLAAQTSDLYKIVTKAKGISNKKGVPPQNILKELRKAGFAKVRLKKIEANEALEWKKRVFHEYYSNMRALISTLSDLKCRVDYGKKLEELRREIVSNGRINWAWGVNYLIQATK